MKDAAKGHLRSFDVVPGPVQAWLDDVVRDYARQTVLVVGHRATFYALEHLINSVPLRDAVLAPWQWQPGWLLKSGLSVPPIRAALHDAASRRI